MSRSILLALAVPTVLTACGAGDTLAPDAAGYAASASATPAPGLVGALGTNRIVFSSLTSDGGSDLWTMDSQGGSQARLTSYAGLESAPKWSHDGKHVAFVRERNGRDDIFLADADGTHKHWASSTQSAYGVSSPSWAPDGSHLLVRVDVQGTPWLAKLDLATGYLTPLASKDSYVETGYTPVYDPTGTSIYYLDWSVMSIKRFIPGGAVTTVVSATVYLQDPVLSPDGKRLAYGKEVTPGNNEIFVLDLATRVIKRLTNSAGWDDRPAWSPDGTKLAFTSTRSGKRQIYVMNSSTGGGVAKITSKSSGATSPSWAH